MLFKNILIILALLNASVTSLSLHKINLQDKKEFEISSDNKDYNEHDENEMIQPADLANIEHYTEDESQYKPLHSFVESYNKRGTLNKMQFANILAYLEPSMRKNYDLKNNEKPFIAGFKEELDKIMKD